MEIPQDCDSIYCGECRTRVAFIENAPVEVWPAGIFVRLFNVDNQNIHQSEFETTLADSCCVQCGKLLGWKFIAVTQPDMDVMVGTFLMRLNMLSFDEENDDQDGDANDQDEGANNEQNTHEQDGGSNQQVPIDQEVGISEQNTDDQDEGGDQDEGTNNEQNTDEQDGCGNLQVPIDQEVGISEQNTDDQDEGGDQDEGTNNEQNTDEEDGCGNQQVPIDQEVGTSEKNTDEQDGGGDQDEGTNNEQNTHEQDGGSNQQVPIDQEVGISEKNTDDQDEGTNNEQNTDEQDGCGDQQVPIDQEVGTNEQNTDDQDGGGDQDEGTNNEQNVNQDGGSNQQVLIDQEVGTNEQNVNQQVPMNQQVLNEPEHFDAIEEDGDLIFRMPSSDYFHCTCGTRVAFLKDYVGTDDIAVPQGSRYEEGQFLMMLEKLTYTNGKILDPYEENVDQDGGPNEENVDQDGGAANEDNNDNQDGGAANEENNDNQDGGANEENADNQLLVPNGLPNGHIVLRKATESEHFTYILELGYFRSLLFLLCKTEIQLYFLERKRSKKRNDLIFRMRSSDYFHCRCGTRVAFVKDYVEIDEELTFVLQGIFTDMFNVEVPENESYHQLLDGKTVVDTFCVNCMDRLGWKFIAVPQGSPYEEGQFLMMLDKLNYTNGQLSDPYDLAGGANEENVDQAGGPNEENNDNQDGGANEENNDNQAGGANQENADNQDGGANEENNDNQDGGANQENADNQDGGANNEENVDNQDGGGDQPLVSNGNNDRNLNI
ncbi:uncharacterized protein DDB_G0290685-like [Solanum tuberosum]|nr:PREDICTED: uncharacterized protein DDB_G0290685-like [Solanum tuberosum]